MGDTMRNGCFCKAWRYTSACLMLCGEDASKRARQAASASANEGRDASNGAGANERERGSSWTRREERRGEGGNTGRKNGRWARRPQRRGSGANMHCHQRRAENATMALSGRDQMTGLTPRGRRTSVGDGRPRMVRRSSQTVSVDQNEGDGSRFHHGCQQRVTRCGRAACHSSRRERLEPLLRCDAQLRSQLSTSSTWPCLPVAPRYALGVEFNLPRFGTSD